MNPVPDVTYTTPDGVKRPVRLTFGARRRIAERFGKPLPDVLKQYDSAALPGLLYCCMFDDAAGGKPPKGLSPDWADALDLNSEMDTEMSAVFMQAVLKGSVEKNVLVALIRQETAKQMETLLGSISGPSPDSASDSQTDSSGPAQSESSTPSSTDTENANEQPTSERG